MDSPIQLMGIIGKDTRQSDLFYIYNYIFNKLNVFYQYVPLETLPQNIENGIKGIKNMRMLGANIGSSYSNKVIPYLDYASEEDKILNYINLIHNDSDFLVGFNTEIKSIISAIQNKLQINPNGETILILGTGYKSITIALKLALMGAKKIFLEDRTAEHRNELELKINRNAPDCEIIYFELNKSRINEIIDKVNILINTKPSACNDLKQEALISDDNLSKNKIIIDLELNPSKSLLEKKARLKGCPVINGIELLTFQCILDFETLTGEKLGENLVREAIINHYKR